VKNTYNTLRQIYLVFSTKFYQNWPGFVDDVTNTFSVFEFAVPIAVDIQNVNATF